ncbi:MAG: GNAT family N-acetyltransferase [Magnetococcales bacterium]|nr:GNAT family N-acetyltransferase [Magnetococcales bacterium]MBF0631910.1 GNAT family N-acetyltransferase [Magnetococcales bacterium]
MKICKAGIHDFLEIAALDRVAWEENDHHDFIPDGEHVWRIWVEHALVYCAKDERGRIIGAILSFPGIDNIYCVHKVFVGKEERKKGIASALFMGLLREIDKISVDCFLTVDPVNKEAIRVYDRFGFHEKVFIKGYYRSNEDRFVLTRRQKSSI